MFRKELEKKKDLFITRKIYFIPYGIDSAEVFMYADIVWKLSVYDKLTPYKLDGIIYTPINSPYSIKTNTDNLDIVPLEYKWKIPLQNSIDFFIKFDKDNKGNDTIYYDNTVIKAEGNSYKICKLYVGINRAGEEKPIPFKINGIEQNANLYLVDGEVVDLEGNIINDETVVEFIFDISKIDINDAYKWIPLKTRYDKTESVQKYKKKYGNNLNIAQRIWRTIVNPITEENIAALANSSTYPKEIERLSKNIEKYSEQKFTYYQKKTSNAAGMRAFNNWIKSNMILTYCQNKNSILDIGCGRGGDLIKFIHAGIKEYVGVDVDNNGLYVINDSAHNRYKNLKNSHKNVPPMYFINADARAKFTIRSQESVLSNMTSLNKKLIETYLSGNKKYNVINNQFTIHYYLSDKLSWTNFCDNINNHLEDNGYVLITCFDGKLLHDKLLGKQKMTVSYTDNNGNKNIFFEIIKIYDDADESNIGIAIDLYNSLISNPGIYIREYLVFPDFLQESMKKQCGLELIETDSFISLFNMYRNYFVNDDSDEYTPIDSTKRYEEIKNFYLSLHPGNNKVEADIALASFNLSMLNKYYIFKKSTKIDISEPSRLVGINHKINLGKILTPYFDINKMVIDPSKKSTHINKIYNAIRKKYISIKPSVYLIKHTIIKETFDGEIYRRNKLELSKLKDGTDSKILLIYKSPENYFYPVFHHNIKYNDNENYAQKRVAIKKKGGTHILNSKQLIDDLDLMVILSEKLTKARNNK